ncbi:hypothetical protein FSP39_018725 [Pinctada imbricata]|uniref:Uncharacterized protein n=1 Tax=Pinctada imbricata TaxID=66713 RepID=A0AA89C6Z5_PINIB|nr:hypothetical protein FSP39_018725 [Pinctada imbricata]
MLVRYISQGMAYWHPGDLFYTHCSPDIRDYPYDKQVCRLEFVAWGYNSNEIKSKPLLENTITDLYVKNGAWELIDTKVFVQKYEEMKFEVLNVELHIKRRPTFFLFTMILPIAAMGVLNLFVFFLPPESGERVGYSITLLLAICVFLTIASDNLPKVSYPEVSLLCIKLLIDMIISSFAMLFTIVGLRFYNKDQSSRVPLCISSVTRCILCFRCRKTKKKKFYVKDENRGEVPHNQIEINPPRINQEDNQTLMSMPQNL